MPGIPKTGHAKDALLISLVPTYTYTFRSINTQVSYHVVLVKYPQVTIISRAGLRRNRGYWYKFHISPNTFRLGGLIFMLIDAVATDERQPTIAGKFNVSQLESARSEVG